MLEKFLALRGLRNGSGGGGSGGSGISVTAQVGQTIRVKAVDAKGIPTEWEAVDYQEKICGSEGGGEIPVSGEWVDESGDGTVDVFNITTPIGLEIGKTYIVNWNGTDYEVVCQDMSSATGGAAAVYLGNGADMGFADTGEPFRVLEYGAELASQAGTFGGVTWTNDSAGSGEATFAIRTAETIQTIPPKYLPEVLQFGEMEVSILPETDVTFTDFGGMLAYAAPATTSLVVGETYTVKYDGTEYTCECVDNSGMPFLGDVGGMNGETSTGEPFVVGIVDGMLMIIPMPIDSATSAKVSISGLGIKKLESKYVGRPQYDFASLGLPEIPLDGTLVSCNIENGAEIISGLLYEGASFMFLCERSFKFYSETNFGGGPILVVNPTCVGGTGQLFVRVMLCEDEYWFEIMHTRIRAFMKNN